MQFRSLTIIPLLPIDKMLLRTRRTAQTQLSFTQQYKILLMLTPTRIYTRNKSTYFTQYFTIITQRVLSRYDDDLRRNTRS
jgi:hypothetical protein